LGWRFCSELARIVCVNSLANLAAAENTAARLGSQVISSSYGARETGFTKAHAAASTTLAT
jgi:hypothetical protein